MFPSCFFVRKIQGEFFLGGGWVLKNFVRKYPHVVRTPAYLSFVRDIDSKSPCV